MAALDALLVVSDTVVVTTSVVMTLDVDFTAVVVLKHYRWFRQPKTLPCIRFDVTQVFMAYVL